MTHHYSESRQAMIIWAFGEGILGRVAIAIIYGG